MVKRKKSVKRKPKSNPINRDLNSFQKEINRDVKDVGGWVIARKRFFRRLWRVVLLTLILYLLVRFIQ